MLVRVLFAILLNGHVGEMHKHIIHLSHIAGVELITEPPEPLIVEVRFDRPIAGHQHVDPQIELLSAYKQGIVDVSADNIDFIHVKVLEGSVEVGAGYYLFELVDLLQQEDTYVDSKCTLALRLIVGFDYPSSVGVALEFLQEDGVFSREHVGLWYEVQVVVAPDLILREVVLILLQLLAISLQVFNHQVFTGEFVVVWEVVDYLPVMQPDAFV